MERLRPPLQPVGRPNQIGNGRRPLAEGSAAVPATTARRAGSGTTGTVLLHLSGTGGAALAVCDAVCARLAVRQLSVTVGAVTDGRPAPAGYCRHCAGCGGIIDEPITHPCWRHPEGCPPWDYRHTATAALVLHRFATERGQTLTEEGIRLLDHTLADLAEDPEGLDAEIAYARLLILLPPAP